MSQVFDKALEAVKQYGGNVDEALLQVLAKKYAITQNKADTANVACSDKSELETVAKNFADKKLGVTGDEAMDAIKAVCEDMSRSRMKNRIVFYYLLTKKLGKESVFA